MKILKIIVLLLFTTNFIFAQTYSAPDQGQTGERNVFVGQDAGLNTSVGDGNTFLGHKAGELASVGGRSVFVGEKAGYTATGPYLTAIGFNAGANSSSGYNVFIGGYSGQNNTTGGSNIFIGRDAGKNNVSGNLNTFIGAYAGENSTGNSNMFIGSHAGRANTTGRSNMFIGANTGEANLGGEFNLFLGNGAGKANVSTSRNVYLGINAGYANKGSNNVFIGYEAGRGLETTDNQLYIENSADTAEPLIYGDFARGVVAIDVNYVPNGYKFAVNGKAIAEEVQVMTRGTWPDYVFADDYNLMPLADLETEIKTLGHLPGVPSAEEVETNGHALGRMDAILLEKIEELTLHLIDINKEVKEVRQENKILNADINLLQHENAKLKNEMETLKK